MTASKHSQEPRRHHYVPEFLLRPWTREWQPQQELLRGYYWDRHLNRLRFRENGVGAFCYRLDLLTLHDRREGRAVLESRFFQAIDEAGQRALEKLVDQGPDALANTERCDFVRLLLSLHYRRPNMIERLRREGAATLKAGLDGATDVLSELSQQGIDAKPTEYAETELGWSFEERALLVVQDLVDSRETGQRLLDAHWYLKRLRREHGSFMLSDSPLVRTHGLDNQMATWFLPLSPKVGFFMTKHARSLELIKKASANTIVYHANIDAVSSAEKYAFSVDRYLPSGLSKLLVRPRST